MGLKSEDHPKTPTKTVQITLVFDQTLVYIRQHAPRARTRAGGALLFHEAPEAGGVRVRSGGSLFPLM
jgi:hypothetical protein